MSRVVRVLLHLYIINAVYLHDCFMKCYHVMWWELLLFCSVSKVICSFVRRLSYWWLMILVPWWPLPKHIPFLKMHHRRSPGLSSLLSHRITSAEWSWSSAFLHWSIMHHIVTLVTLVCLLGAFVFCWKQWEWCWCYCHSITTTNTQELGMISEWCCHLAITTTT